MRRRRSRESKGQAPIPSLCSRCFSARHTSFFRVPHIGCGAIATRDNSPDASGGTFRGGSSYELESTSSSCGSSQQLRRQIWAESGDDQSHVGLKTFGEPNSFLSIGSLPNNLEAFLLQNSSYSLTYDRVVIGQKHSNRHWQTQSLFVQCTPECSENSQWQRKGRYGCAA
jgi:hypothetical protein